MATYQLTQKQFLYTATNLWSHSEVWGREISIFNKILLFEGEREFTPAAGGAYCESSLYVRTYSEHNHFTIHSRPGIWGKHPGRVIDWRYRTTSDTTVSVICEMAATGELPISSKMEGVSRDSLVWLPHFFCSVEIPGCSVNRKGIVEDALRLHPQTESEEWVLSL